MPSYGPDMRRLLSAASTAVVTILVLGGCTESPEEVVRTSGPLADGVEIEPGSALIGTVFPSGSSGHQAVLRVDGDLQRVFEGYVRQVVELGYPVGPGWRSLPEEGRWCSDPGNGTGDEEPNEPYVVECEASGFEPGEWHMSVRGLADADGRGFITVRTDPHSVNSSETPAVPDGPAAPVTDEEVSPELTPSMDEPLLIVEGSTLMADPFPATCITGGYVAVLRVTGELMPVMRGYAEQFAAMRAFTTDGLSGDDQEPRVWASAAGGGDLGALGVAGDPSYILIERCND